MSDAYQTLRSLVSGTSSYIDNVYEEWEATPASGSRAAEHQSAEPVERFANHPVSPRPLADGHGMALLTFVAALDHLKALLRTLDDPPLVWSVASNARHVVELSARAWWLLDPDGGIDRIVARYMASLRYSATEAGKLDAAMASGELVTDHIARLDAWMVSVGLPRVARPFATALVGEMLPASGAVMYKTLSQSPHGTLGGLVELVAPDTDPAVANGRATNDFATHLGWTACALFALYAVMDRLTEYFGWRPDEWLSWKRAANETLLGLWSAFAPKAH
jgi:hypothetical protein